MTDVISITTMDRGESPMVSTTTITTTKTTKRKTRTTAATAPLIAYDENELQEHTRKEAGEEGEEEGPTSEGEDVPVVSVGEFTTSSTTELTTMMTSSLDDSSPAVKSKHDDDDDNEDEGDGGTITTVSTNHGPADDGSLSTGAGHPVKATTTTTTAVTDEKSHPSHHPHPHHNHHHHHGNDSISGEYSCIYNNSVKGTLYAGRETLCFLGRFFLFEKTVSLKWTDVRQVQQTDEEGVIVVVAKKTSTHSNDTTTANDTTTHNCCHHTFSNLTNSDRIWSVLVSLHNQALLDKPTNASTTTPTTHPGDVDHHPLLVRTNSDPLSGSNHDLIPLNDSDDNSSSGSTSSSTSRGSNSPCNVRTRLQTQDRHPTKKNETNNKLQTHRGSTVQGTNNNNNSSNNNSNSNNRSSNTNTNSNNNKNNNNSPSGDETLDSMVGSVDGQFACQFQIFHGSLFAGCAAIGFLGQSFLVFPKRIIIPWQDIHQFRVLPNGIEVITNELHLKSNPLKHRSSYVFLVEEPDRVWASLAAVHHKFLIDYQPNHHRRHSKRGSATGKKRRSHLRRNSDPLATNTIYQEGTTKTTNEENRDVIPNNHNHDVQRDDDGGRVPDTTAHDDEITDRVDGDNPKVGDKKKKKDVVSPGKHRYLQRSWSKIIDEKSSCRETVVKDFALGCDLDTFFEVFLSNNAEYSLSAFMTEQGDKDVQALTWNRVVQNGELSQKRVLHYNHPVNAPLAPPMAHARKEQTYKRYGDHGLCVVTETYVDDVPMADCFYVSDRLIVQPTLPPPPPTTATNNNNNNNNENDDNSTTATNDGGVLVTMEFEFTFVKSTMFRGVITKTASSELHTFFCAMAEFMAKSLGPTTTNNTISGHFNGKQQPNNNPCRITVATKEKKARNRSNQVHNANQHQPYISNRGASSFTAATTTTAATNATTAATSSFTNTTTTSSYYYFSFLRFGTIVRPWIVPIGMVSMLILQVWLLLEMRQSNQTSLLLLKEISQMKQQQQQHGQ